MFIWSHLWYVCHHVGAHNFRTIFALITLMARSDWGNWHETTKKLLRFLIYSLRGIFERPRVIPPVVSDVVYSLSKNFVVFVRWLVSIPASTLFSTQFNHLGKKRCIFLYLSGEMRQKLDDLISLGKVVYFFCNYPMESFKIYSHDHIILLGCVSSLMNSPYYFSGIAYF